MKKDARRDNSGFLGDNQSFQGKTLMRLNLLSIFALKGVIR